MVMAKARRLNSNGNGLAARMSVAYLRRSLDLPHRWAARAACPFYRLYPYQGQLPFPRADARGAVSVEDQFLYNRIPKVANSTIIATLVRHASLRHGFEPTVPDKEVFPRPSRINAHSANRVGPAFFKFVFVRNPFTRVLSAYLDKIVRPDQGHKAYRRYLRQTGAGRDYKVPSFSDFCRYIADSGLYDDAHWAPQTDCLILPFDRFDFVGRFEALDRDLTQVIATIFPDQTVEPVTAGPTPTRAAEHLTQHYTARDVAIVQELFAKDFEMLGYDAKFPG